MKDNEPIIVTHLFNASLEQVWEALTNVKQMRLWYFDVITDFKPEVSFQTSFLIMNEGRNFTHNWKVTEVIPQSKISYRWTFDEYPGESISTFRLSKEEHRTILTVTSEVLKEFPTDIPEFKRESGVAGWKYLIKERLFEFLQKSIKF
ncbi:SRPBCC family protein [Maribacter aquivivus]|uniref:SRPBCC family protein n=1 Tax=Maribacter aquivivus TaxID=228958 RepID=UPI0024908502|nr:SRPBCC domain-containing protein [Maribacter aquivivus]